MGVRPYWKHQLLDLQRPDEVSPQYFEQFDFLYRPVDNSMVLYTASCWVSGDITLSENRGFQLTLSVDGFRKPNNCTFLTMNICISSENMFLKRNIFFFFVARPTFLGSSVCFSLTWGVLHASGCGWKGRVRKEWPTSTRGCTFLVRVSTKGMPSTHTTDYVRTWKVVCITIHSVVL